MIGSDRTRTGKDGREERGESDRLDLNDLINVLIGYETFFVGLSSNEGQYSTEYYIKYDSFFNLYLILLITHKECNIYGCAKCHYVTPWLFTR